MKIVISFMAFIILLTDNVSASDKVKQVKYNPNDIITLSAKEGLLTIVEFDEGEEVLDGSTGFNEGWTVKKSGNIAYITPKPYISSIGVSDDGEMASHKSVIQPNKNDWKTNFFIRTNERLYVGDLILSRNRSHYKIKMRYPKLEAEDRKEIASVRAKKREKQRVKKALNRTSVPRNWDFYKKVNKRSKDIVPNYVYDDGKFTYFGFDRTKKMPAIFLRDGKEESSVNSHTKRVGRYYVKVVHKTGEVFFLRSGRKLVGVLNSGYGVNPNLNFDTTSNSTIKRVIK